MTPERVKDMNVLPKLAIVSGAVTDGALIARHIAHVAELGSAIVDFSTDGKIFLGGLAAIVGGSVWLKVQTAFQHERASAPTVPQPSRRRSPLPHGPSHDHKNPR